MAEALPAHLLATLPRALDIIGDIAVVEIPPELKEYKKIVGEAVLKGHKNVRVVLAKAGKVSGTYRLRHFEFLAGERRSLTLYRENGCSYYVDVARAYFSPRLSHERQRVASAVKEGEVVVDLFSGVGPFAILIAKNLKTVKVYAIDINLDAVDLLKRNARLNRVENRIYPIVGDARQVANEGLAAAADRVIMNLPESSFEFIDVACNALKTGGMVHFYAFMRAPETIEELGKRFEESVQKVGRKVQTFENARLVRETAPYEWQVVLDARIG
jgi:tRNA (guanine37-N1)-methyltransferase